MKKILFLTMSFALMSQASANFPVNNITHQAQALINQTNNLSPKTIKTALKVYQCAREKGLDQKQIYTLIDYTLPSYQKRFWVIDMIENKILYHTWAAHGQGSGSTVAKHFSDLPRTHETSIGLFKTAGTYYGHDGYSLRLVGLDKGFNDNALARDIVVHGAWYVSESFIKKYGRIGRSWGCPALNKNVSRPIINQIKNGTLLLAYYPDDKWLNESKYLHCD